MKLSAKKILIQILKIVFAIGIIAWLVLNGHLDLTSIKYVMHPKFLFSCLVLVLGTLLFSCYRWFILLRAQGFNISFLQTTPLFFIGLFFNFAIPGSVGGDVVKAYYLAKHYPQRKIQAAMTVLLDRVIGLFAMMALGLIAMLARLDLVLENTSLNRLFFALTVLFVVTAAMFAIFLSERIKNNSFLLKLFELMPAGEFVKNVHSAFQEYRNKLGALVATFFISFICQFFTVIFFFVVAIALKENISFFAILFAVSLGFIASAIPLAPAGIGVGQVAFLFLVKAYTGEDLQVGTIGITIFQIALFIWSMIGALFYLQNRNLQISDEGELNVR